jgi:hypothetical protein
MVAKTLKAPNFKLLIGMTSIVNSISLTNYTPKNFIKKNVKRENPELGKRKNKSMKQRDLKIPKN